MVTLCLADTAALARALRRSITARVVDPGALPTLDGHEITVTGISSLARIAFTSGGGLAGWAGFDAALEIWVEFSESVLWPAVQRD